VSAVQESVKMLVVFAEVKIKVIGLLLKEENVIVDMINLTVMEFAEVMP
jgi:hypothetical protein